jgi:general nucleoside transport system permease protein
MTTIDASEAVGAPAVGDRGGVWVARLQRLAAFGLRWLLVLLLALIAFGIVLLFSGRNPVDAYGAVFSSTLGSSYGLSEVLVKMTPMLLCALAVILPARIGLVQVGGEGQIYMGAWLSAGAALWFGESLPPALALPVVIIAAFVGGGLWALLPGWLRAKGWLNETIATLLLNYVAILFVTFFIFGPWRDPASANFPQTPQFADAYRFPPLGDTRIHLGLILALVATGLTWWVLNFTRWGYEMRAVGSNPVAGRRHGLPITTYILVVMFVAGGLAGLAGAGEILAIQGRLRPGISPGYGYVGFLIAWISGQNPLAAVAFAFLMAVISLGGDTLQITQQLPFAAVNVWMAVILFIVLGDFVPRRLFAGWGAGKKGA